MKRLSKAEARIEFLRWMKSYDPAAYEKLLSASGEGLGAADKPATGFWDNLANTFNKVLPTITQSVAQAKIFRAQMKRAQRGLPPLKTEEYAPTMKIQADIAPSTRSAIFAETGAALKKYVMPMAAVGLLAAVWFLVRKK